MEDTEGGRSRINGAMLHNYQGKSVCVLGMPKDTAHFNCGNNRIIVYHISFTDVDWMDTAFMHKVDTNGTAFTLTTSDNSDVHVLMREPLSEYLAGLTEVHGEVDASNNVICQNYILFSTEASQSFDVNLYNTAVEVMAKLPEHYITGIVQQ